MVDELLYRGSLDIHHRIVAMYPKIAARDARFRSLQEVSTRLRPAGFRPAVDCDRVLCALAVKAATTKDSIALLCESGHGASALGLMRVLLENAMLMAWQRLGPGRERLETYVLFTSAQQERGADVFKAVAEQIAVDREPKFGEADPYNAAIAQHVFAGNDDTWAYFPNPDNPRELQRVSMRRMTKEVMEKSRPIEYELFYWIGSEEIHSGPLSLGPALRKLRSRETFAVEPAHERDGCLQALAISNVAMLSVLKTLDGYAGLGIEEELDQIYADIKTLGEPNEEGGTGALS